MAALDSLLEFATSLPLTHLSGLLLEAVGGLLAVPDGPRQRELPADAVLADGPQGAPPQLLGLDVVRLHPEHLQLGVVGLRELEALDDAVHLLEVALVEVDERLRLQHRLVAVQQLARRQGPQESEETIRLSMMDLYGIRNRI